MSVMLVQATFAVFALHIDESSVPSHGLDIARRPFLVHESRLASIAAPDATDLRIASQGPRQELSRLRENVPLDGQVSGRTSPPNVF